MKSILYKALHLFTLCFLISSVGWASSYTEIKADLINGVNAPQNLLKNPTAQKNLQYWTASAGTFVRTTTASEIPNKADGAFSWDASAASQTLTTTAVAIPAGWYGEDGVVVCSFKCASGTCTHTLTADDGTNNLATPQTITSSTSTFPTTPVNFIYPSSGNIRLKLTSAADEPKVTFGACIIGLAKEYNVSQVSQATLYGTLTYAATTNCNWSTTSGSMASFSADSDCATPTVTGGVTAPATKIPGFVMTNAPPGSYLVLASAVMYADIAATQNCFWRLTDGTTNGPAGNQTGGNEAGDYGALNQLSQTVTYTSSGNRNFEIQGVKIGGTSTCNINAGNTTAGSDLVFYVYRFPTSSETAYRADQSAWYVDATMDGANPSLGTSAQTSYVEITDAGLTLKPQSGSQPVGVMCSTTNAATAPSTSNTTCAAGSESVGINFTIPRAGSYEVCFQGSHYVDVDNNGQVQATFELIETPTNAQTLTLEGGTRVESGNYGPSAASTRIISAFPHTNCSIFNWSSAGTKGVRLMYEQSVTATVNNNLLLADAGANNGQRNMRWTVKPVTGNMPMPLLVGGVTSGYSGNMRIEMARINCDSSSATTEEFGGVDWINGNPTNISAGSCTISFNSNIFSARPYCFVQDETGAPVHYWIQSFTTSSVAIKAQDTTGADRTTWDAFIKCVGGR